ncbi:MAG: D-aminoacyl-tRNA deacylase [Chthonomonadales bacterium]
MRAVVQRVLEGKVEVNGAVVGAIQQGLHVLVGVHKDDSVEDAAYIAGKIANMRIFEDVDGKMNLSLLEVGRSALIVSQFTLYGDARKGRRPGFSEAASGEFADQLYREVCEQVAGEGIQVERGVFGAEMKVTLVNDGPVTILLDSTRAF